jgi:predicted metal-binding membrane protein
LATLAAVTASRSRTPLEARAWLRSVGRSGPEAWVWPVAAVAGVVLFWGGLGWYPFGIASEAGHHASMMPVGTAHGFVDEMAHHLVLWIALVGAPMLPLIAWNLRSVGLRSPRVRRRRATLDVAAGWAAVWLAAGLLISVVMVVAQMMGPFVLTVGLVSAAAVAWQFSRIKSVALARCHRRFAPPLGAAAGPTCVSFGRNLGRDCLLSCWPGMVMMAVAGHHPLAVVVLGWLSWRDRRRPHDRPGTAVSVPVLLAVGGFSLLGQG